MSGRKKMENEKIPEFLTIRGVAATGLLPENALRTLAKESRLPCVYVGSRCLINFTRLVEVLNASPQQPLNANGKLHSTNQDE